MLTGGLTLLDNAPVNNSFDGNNSYDDGNQSINSQSNQSNVSFKSNTTTNTATNSRSGRNSSRKSKKLQPLHETEHRHAKTPDLDHVLDKIKRKKENNSNTKREWTEDSMRDLVKSR